MMERAVIYCRVSTDAQERDGTSLDTQEAACIEYVERNGWEVSRVIRDTRSGATLDRPGIEELREALSLGEVDIVVAYALDRLSRNQLKTAVLIDELTEAGAELKLVSEDFESSPTGLLLTQVRAFAASLEREKIVERTQRGKVARARSGRIPQGTGRGMYGYIYDRAVGVRRPHETQAPIVRRIFEEFVAHRSCNRIAEALNAEQLPAFAGGRWHALTVRRIVSNETYTGRTVFRRTVAGRGRSPKTGRLVRQVTLRDELEWIEIPDASPALVSEEMFARAQAILADPDRRKRLEGASAYLLGGCVRCGECGGAMTGHVMRQGDRTYRYYRCTRGSSGPGETHCSSKYARAERLDATVRAEIAKLLSDPKRLLAGVKRATRRTASGRKVAKLREQLARIDAEKSRLVDLYLAATFDKSQLDEKSESLDRQSRKLHRELTEALAGGQVLDLEKVEPAISNMVGLVREWVLDLDDEGIRLALTALDVTATVLERQVMLSGSSPVDDGLAPFQTKWAAVDRG